MAVSNYKELTEHLGHTIEVARYGDENVTIECIDCGCVLVSFDKEKETNG